MTNILATLTLPPDCHPEDLAVSPSGILAVADSGPGKNIRLFDAKTGKAKGTFGTTGGALAPGRYQGQIRDVGAFFSPRSVDIDGRDFLYVLDSAANGLAPRISKHAPNASGTNWDARGAVWAAQAQVIGAALVFDHADPGKGYMKGFQVQVDLSGDHLGEWRAVRLVSPFGQASWESLPSDLPESRIPIQEAGAVVVGRKRFVVAWNDSDRFALTAAD